MCCCVSLFAYLSGSIGKFCCKTNVKLLRELFARFLSKISEKKLQFAKSSFTGSDVSCSRCGGQAGWLAPSIIQVRTVVLFICKRVDNRCDISVC